MWTDKALVRAVLSAQTLLLLHCSVPAGSARPHPVQRLPAAHGNGPHCRGQLHCVSHPDVFCIYYISRGVLQENRQELVVFVLSVLLVMVRSIVNFSVQEAKSKQELLVRFVCIMTLGVIHVCCTTLLIQRPNIMAFRVGGALEILQEQYFLLNLCFSMVTFDLQAQLCLCILITTSDVSMSAQNTIILAVGVVWACLTAAVGAAAVLKEAKIFVWVFMVQNLPQLAFFVYLIYTVVTRWLQDRRYTLEAAAVTGALISLVIKVVLLWGLIRLVHSFGQGLRERMFAPSK
ncbi:uncharacterized protein LOC117494020 isoform X2 [Trematomus bernacchii]|uniref:uncharacterized protein LOC117494020 isoform X2 n=1 Tax=Trematomus bernacchii TaxID=40690 RepID=UPI00146CBB25|nr:uncharacterized protein LOC117494020 isoform X2 [Trematomus bernacchii]